MQRLCVFVEFIQPINVISGAFQTRSNNGELSSSPIVEVQSLFLGEGLTEVAQLLILPRSFIPMAYFAATDGVAYQNNVTRSHS